jgi:hypothetical protein
METDDDRHDTQDPGLLLRLQLSLWTRLPLRRRPLQLWVWVRVGASPRILAEIALDHPRQAS